MKKKNLLLIVCVFTCLQIGAQTSFDDFKTKATREFSTFKKKSNDDFENFRKKSNDEYAEFLRKSWSEYESLKTPNKPKEEKQIPPKPYEELNEPIKDTPKPYEEIIIPKPPKPQPTPVVPIKETPEVEQWYSFTYYGISVKVRLNNEHKFKLQGCDGKLLSDAWSKLSSSKYNNVIADCLSIRKKLNLCDWGYLMLINSLANSFMGENTNEATLFMAFIYCQSGYKMKLAHNNGRLYMLYSTEHMLYDKTYFALDGEKYYPLNCNEERIYICDATFPNERPLSLYVSSVPQLGINKTSDRQLASRRYPNVKAIVSSNKNLIEFCNTYPASEIGGNFMTKWAMYANTPLSNSTRSMLYPSLQSSISGLSQLEAVECLLNFTQTAFVYGYDSKIWGYDRAFFAEETLYYPYCDCEDRSILFSRLIRDLIGLNVVLVYYPGHLATAVKFTTPVKGDYLMIDGSKYVICDPTYIGAPVGRTMPEMDNTQAKVILLD